MRAFVVLDTNVASWVFDRAPELDPYVEDIRGKRTAIAFQTVAEMRLGARLANWGDHRMKELDRFLARTRRIGFDERLVSAWVDVVERGQRIGAPMSVADAWIAAVAIVHSATLVTDDNDFVDLGMRELDVVCHAPRRSKRKR